VVTLRLAHRVEDAEQVIDLLLEGAGAPMTAEARFALDLTAQDREDLRWYLEDYRQYPVDPAPLIAGRVETRLAALGAQLFTGVFGSNPDARRLWDAVAELLPETRVEVAAGEAGDAAVPWELLRDPATDSILALRAAAFVRSNHNTAQSIGPTPGAPGILRVLLVICRPGGPLDVPFRSVASRLVRLSPAAREAFQLQVLRPPTFAALRRALAKAQQAGQPYHVVHFDGHGIYQDRHGFLVFEDPEARGKSELVGGPALGALLARTGVPVLAMNACRSAHADLLAEPATVPPETGGPGTPAAERDAQQRIRAYGSLAEEVMDGGVAGVVAMRYNVYVDTAAQFIGSVYAGLLAGRELGAAVSLARRQLAAGPVPGSLLLSADAQPPSVQDWLVPVVYEAAPVALPTADPAPVVELGQLELGQTEASRERAVIDPATQDGAVTGFFGRDETLLALDRAFDTAPAVLLQAWAGAGKTATAQEFARWYKLTGAVDDVLFTSFTQHVPLAALFNQVGDRLGPALAQLGVEWATVAPAERRARVLQVLNQLRVLWVWDNVEPVAGFPAGSGSAWTTAEQGELAQFLRDLASSSRCRVLLTSRRDERAWLGNLYRRVDMPAMPMLERLELAQAVALTQPGGAERFARVQDWRPLLEFTQGNPLAVTILVRQAIRDRRRTTGQIESFVADLRAGAAQVTDDASQGRASSLAASLDYGFRHAFADDERAKLALLSLFQGFVNADALCLMGDPEWVGQAVPQVAGLSHQDAVALLDRAAEVGLLTARAGGCFAVHPAVPWYLSKLFRQHYGPPGGQQTMTAVRAWIMAIGTLGNRDHNLHGQGDDRQVSALAAEEANLLQARKLAIEHGWPELIIYPMQGLDVLYRETGRAAEWRRLVDELVPVLSESATGRSPGPAWARDVLTGYRVRIATLARDWPVAESLQEGSIAWRREQAAGPLAAAPETLNEMQRLSIRSYAVAIHGLADIQREQRDRACVPSYLEAMKLCQRIAARREEGMAAYNLGRAYEEVWAIRDLDKAARWYQRYRELLRGDDAKGQAALELELGNLALQRLDDAETARAPAEQLARHANDAIASYLESLRLTPARAIADLAVVHNQLGIAYRHIGQHDTAFGYFQKSIKYQEAQNDLHGAGSARCNAARSLEDAGHYHDALLYARVGLRDLEAVGPGAAVEAERASQMIVRLSQELPDERRD